MKNILVLTDFSKAAKHAAGYAYSLAKQIQANVILCNVVIVPAEVPQRGLVVWPLEESGVLLDESETELQDLVHELEAIEHDQIYKPDITFNSKAGILQNVVREIKAGTRIDYLVMATHGAGLNGMMLGNHTRTMIDEVGDPLFVIPPLAKIGPIRKIALATDFEDPDREMSVITKVIALAALLQAEVYITHVYKDSEASPDFYKSVQKVMLDIFCENDYAKIHYKAIKNVDTKKGLLRLMQSDMDLLVVIHRSHGFLHKLVLGSLTQKLVGERSVPLLVFKEGPSPALI